MDGELTSSKRLARILKLVHRQGLLRRNIAMAQNEYRHAVVIGAGIAALATARVLSDHFERVTIVERDHTPGLDEFRSGVPQNIQPHALLKRGLLELENLFPGFAREWEANGA